MLPDFFRGLQLDGFTGVLMGTRDQYDRNRPLQLWSLGCNSGTTPVVVPSFDLLHDLISRPLVVHRFQLVDWLGRTQDPEVLPAIVVGAECIETASGLDFLPMDLCPVGGVLPEIVALIREIQADPLRRFVREVLEEREVTARYWTMPASARHHHAHAGGLAEHSLEVAEDIATQGQLTGIERDLGIAGGLLHDIGKIWAYTSDMFPSTSGQAMGHELLGLARVERHLRALEIQWPDGAFAMRVLLSGCGRVRQDGSLPSALVARIRACDQRSCERNRGHAARTSRSWMPKPWSPLELVAPIE